MSKPDQPTWLTARARHRLTREGHERAVLALRTDGLSTLPFIDPPDRQRRLEAQICARLARSYGLRDSDSTWFAGLGVHATRTELTIDAGETTRTSRLLDELVPCIDEEDQVHGVPGLRAHRVGSFWQLTHLKLPDALVRIATHGVLELPDSPEPLLTEDRMTSAEQNRFDADEAYAPRGLEDWILLCSRLLRRPALLDPCSLGAETASVYTKGHDLCLEWTGPLETGQYFETVLGAHLDVTSDPHYDEVLFIADHRHHTNQVITNFGKARFIFRRHPD
ncbi:hypothetical protein [Nocardia sp. NBC_01327]|uniref:hypothetical protein n=1 Tax=Nocardia sp. NBC_01327 TaxID=2903593 RepID=UPI002E0F094E|nr:hypothetical protein OG326_42270 [Nocardia sp. NBC_01327]